MLDLNDEKWKYLRGGYRTDYDSSILLKELENTQDENRIKKIMDELWENLHHQGNVGLASYYAIPHLIRIGIKNQIKGYDIPAIVSVIETERHSNNPKLPEEYEVEYKKEIKDVIRLISQNQENEWERDYAACATAAIAAVNGQIDLAKTILEMIDKDLASKFEFLMENYDEIEELVNKKRML